MIVRTASDREVLEMALIENLQREDLNPIEEAEAYSRLAREFLLKQEEIAQRVGKNRATVANAMRLLELAAAVKGLLISGQLSAVTRKCPLAQGPVAADRRGGTDRAATLTVRATEQFVADAGKAGALPAQVPAGKKAAVSRQPAEVTDLEERLRERLSTCVAIHHGEKKGRIEIEYYGNTDPDRILNLIGLPSRYDVL